MSVHDIGISVHDIGIMVRHDVATDVHSLRARKSGSSTDQWFEQPPPHVIEAGDSKPLIYYSR
ncbi:MAG: hypothetical protein QGG64_23305 [Candidatus Latescibacteria bacterium]|nr:hypothetical protein [Candidatus Latescibacterota bacterium]MDP7268913.1 hypothetical protein [Pirellulales bacterium]HJN66074.1 hypothetical protein [Pirellulales bacterium]